MIDIQKMTYRAYGQRLLDLYSMNSGIFQYFQINEYCILSCINYSTWSLACNLRWEVLNLGAFVYVIGESEDARLKHTFVHWRLPMIFTSSLHHVIHFIHKPWVDKESIFRHNGGRLQISGWLNWVWPNVIHIKSTNLIWSFCAYSVDNTIKFNVYRSW